MTWLFKLWMICLFRAAHEDKTVFLIGRTTIQKAIQRQFVTGVNSLFDDYYPPKLSSQTAPDRVWPGRTQACQDARFGAVMENARKNSETCHAPCPHLTTVVTVCNYDTYNRHTNDRVTTRVFDSGSRQCPQRRSKKDREKE